MEFNWWFVVLFIILNGGMIYGLLRVCIKV